VTFDLSQIQNLLFSQKKKIYTYKSTDDFPNPKSIFPKELSIRRRKKFTYLQKRFGKEKK